jgi:hypothetical protein
MPLQFMTVPAPGENNGRYGKYRVIQVIPPNTQFGEPTIEKEWVVTVDRKWTPPLWYCEGCHDFRCIHVTYARYFEVAP